MSHSRRAALSRGSVATKLRYRLRITNPLWQWRATQPSRNARERNAFRESSSIGIVMNVGQTSIDDYSQLRRSRRRRSSPSSCDHLAKLDSFLNAQSPKFIAKDTVCIDRRAAVEQAHQSGERIVILELFALAPRTRGCEDDSVTHGVKTYSLNAARTIGEVSIHM